MAFAAQLILVLGALLVVSVLVSRVSERFGVPLLLLFLVLGMLLGEDGPGGIVFNDISTAFAVASVALAIILFDGGLRTPIALFRLGLQPALVLATLGVVITAAITGLAAVYVFDFGVLEGLLLGAIVGSTDAAAVFYLLQSHGLNINERLRSTLEIESGSNDPMAIFLTLALIELLRADGGSGALMLAGSFLWQIGGGAAIGLAAGCGLAVLVNRITLTPTLYPVLVLGGGLTTFGVAAVLGSSGFLAAYVAGVAAGHRMTRARHEVRSFHDGMAWLSQAALFLILGLLVTPTDLIPLALPALGVAVVLIAVARPLAVAVSLLPFRFDVREQAFIAWVGLRGGVPIVLGLLPLLAGIAEGRTDFNIAFFVVLVSLLVQGSTVAPAARWLGLELPPRISGRRLLEFDAPGTAGRDFVAYEVVDGAAAVARSADDLPLPDSARVVAVARDGEPTSETAGLRLQPGDHVYLVASADDMEALDEVFGRQEHEGPERRDFYGPFTLRGDANLGELAELYGLPIAEAAAGQTLDAFIRDRLGGAVAIGDSVRLGEVELVVREMRYGRVRKVGLNLAGRGRGAAGSATAGDGPG